MISKLKNYIMKDVDNRNEAAESAIVLRICSIILILYIFILSFSFVTIKASWVIGINLILMGVYAKIFKLTYCNCTMKAAVMFNATTVICIAVDVFCLGWDIGFQQFLFALILLNLVFSNLSSQIQFGIVVIACLLRLVLYFACMSIGPRMVLPQTVDLFLKIVTTIFVFLMIYVCGVILCMDSQIMERKLRSYNKELEEMATTDTLTKLWNRLHLMNYMEKKVRNQNYEFLSIAIGDIDFFKKINDTYGHECGDLVLKSMAEVFKEKMEGHGVVARWGGEEFIFLYENANGDEAKAKLAELQQAVNKKVISYNGYSIHVTMTFGLVEYEYEHSLDDNIQLADERLYIGKQAGRDRIVF